MRNLGGCLSAALLLLGCSRGGPSTETLAPISSGSAPVQVWGAATPVAVALDPSHPPVVSASVQTEPLAASKTSEVRNVIVTVTLRGAPATSNVAVEYEAPTASPYERQVGTISNSNLAPQSVAFKLPVAGTFIDTSSLAGTWRAHVFVDGQERTVSSFELTP